MTEGYDNVVITVAPFDLCVDSSHLNLVQLQVYDTVPRVFSMREKVHSESQYGLTTTTQDYPDPSWIIKTLHYCLTTSQDTFVPANQWFF